MMVKQRIFITGGSGYIGSAIIEQATAQGYEVYGISRNETSDARLTGLGAVPVRGDLHSLDVLREQSAHADIVMHLADPMAANHHMPYEERIRIDDAAVEAIGAGLEGSNKPLVVTSGTLVVAATGAETDETSPLWEKPLNDRIVCEQNNLKLCEKGVKVSVIRLAPFVYGRGASGVGLFMKMYSNMKGVSYVEPGDVFTSAVHVEDAASLYILAAQKAKAGDIFNGVSSTNVTFRQLSEVMGDVLGLPVQSVPFDTAASRWGEFYALFLSTENRASGAKAMRELGWEPNKVGIIEDVKCGSYVSLTESLKGSTVA
ncbi:putative NAD dependent epimerase/dehydratase [Aspergillus heteromorphus CBS 117.55]|uniref:Putative NAD dependent epimerase/dehydratase n=1 Tax=Aspergillus heteromorphus CBS 117.55 TaxID=1448321 RepID=A0A317VZ45_9EURO|nr:putative NAD dependent epimerase/dehydratase [Aspergillus heteromorphus CBS 117.55]PWY78292.1 putative NAD dependent epimerase/dehydratase [Aspergillus heteromorphus CBS 117.55]